MELGYILRNKAYWLISSVKKSPVKGYVDEFCNYYGKDIKKIKEIQNIRLKELLEHACQTTEFYKSYEGDMDIKNFPIISKEDLKKEVKKFMSDKFTKGELVTTTTSGSTGTPFTYYLTKDKKYRQNAEIIFFNNWAGCDVGTKHGYVRVTKTKSKMKLFMQNEILMDPTSINNEWLEKQRQKLLNRGIESLIGYPSAILALAEYCNKKGDKSEQFNLKGIITSSETLYESTRKLIKETFGCDVISRYSTEEFGVLAHECTVEKLHHVNELSYVVEILDIDSDNPVNPGELGRVVVTDLFSHAMPLIRYDTGDLAILGEGCNCGMKGMVLERIEGRRIETIYDTKGERVSAFAINGAMRDLKEVYQYQFIQDSPTLNTLKLCTSKTFNEEELIIKRFKDILGQGSNINIEYVDEIPKLKSGKRPYIISNYKK